MGQRRTLTVRQARKLIERNRELEDAMRTYRAALLWAQQESRGATAAINQALAKTSKA